MRAVVVLPEEREVPPLRCAPVGMTVGRGWRARGTGGGGEKREVPPLRCAPVGMTVGEDGVREWQLRGIGLVLHMRL